MNYSSNFKHGQHSVRIDYDHDCSVCAIGSGNSCIVLEADAKAFDQNPSLQVHAPDYYKELMKGFEFQELDPRRKSIFARALVRGSPEVRELVKKAFL